MRAKTVKIFTGVFLLFMVMVFLPVKADSAWWQFSGAPQVPDRTREVKKETRKMNGENFTLWYYISELDPQEVKVFYEKELKVSGWVKKDILKEIGANQQAQFQGVLASYLEKNIIFEKGNEFIMVSLMPSGVAFGTPGLRYNVVRGLKPSTPLVSNKTDIMPKLVRKPKKQVAPEYPGSSLITLREDSNFLSAAYMSNDNLEAVAGFFRERMPMRGWELVSEDKPQKVDIQNAGVDLAQACPTCSSSQMLTDKNIDVWLAKQYYENKNGDTYSIIISVAKMSGEQLPNTGATSIVVNYSVHEK